MSFEAVCTEDMKIRFTNTGGPPDLVYGGDLGTDPVRVVPTYSTAVRWRNRRIVTEKVSITFSEATGGCAFTSVTHTFVTGAAFILTSSIPTRVEQKSVLRNGDRSVLGCIGSWTAPNSAPVACKCGVEIVDAGQDKVESQ